MNNGLSKTKLPLQRSIETVFPVPLRYTSSHSPQKRTQCPVAAHSLLGKITVEKHVEYSRHRFHQHTVLYTKFMVIDQVLANCEEVFDNEGAVGGLFCSWGWEASDDEMGALTCYFALGLLLCDGVLVYPLAARSYLNIEVVGWQIFSATGIQPDADMYMHQSTTNIQAKALSLLVLCYMGVERKGESFYTLEPAAFGHKEKSRRFGRGSGSPQWPDFPRLWEGYALSPDDEDDACWSSESGGVA
ncbi:hypothetical protein C8R44DRAFT_729691 [Mycena epipterygia]|nr:hypothetical protein C8R44DRAFT_729691 [Mycena epipterygia]